MRARSSRNVVPGAQKLSIQQWSLFLQHLTRSPLGLFEQLARAGKTVIVVTHDRGFSERYDRVLTLADGAVQSDERRPLLRQVAQS